ncbi:NUDIX domain-containing protein [Burkholderia gladioli]|nr:NUDIX pyrophosphatase [Burkholderia gladioli pv. gladioli]PRE19311.1 NUDIX domain-containing protein [Burkholderia gladioli]PRE82186.1 NUDIX domain-containing protein [Burkholderia gladioli]PRG98838.1 NUDIX domain-containing protein [Burkholderia gladioli]
MREESMRAPFQVLAIPYRIGNKGITFAALKRSDDGHWQGVAGGGEVGETPLQAAIRECREEVGLGSRNTVRRLKSQASIPVAHFTDREHWPADVFVIPEYCFGLDCTGKDLVLSREHVDVRWGTYRAINTLLRWDSNKTALWELNCRFGNT